MLGRASGLEPGASAKDALGVLSSQVGSPGSSSPADLAPDADSPLPDERAPPEEDPNLNFAWTRMWSLDLLRKALGRRGMSGRRAAAGGLEAVFAATAGGEALGEDAADVDVTPRTA